MNSMLQTITYTFPSNTNSSREFFRYLSLLLKELPNSEVTENNVTITASSPSSSLPITTFEQKNVSFPAMSLGPDPELKLRMGEFMINGESKTSETSQMQNDIPHGSRFTIQELYEKLQGHLIRIDHTGVNVPTAFVTQKQWQVFVGRIGAQSNLYKYPTGEPWFFILPATKAEFETDITTFPTGREPKCELVYDNYSSLPTIQIDIETDLERKEVEALFPDPYGVSFPGLADYFRTVYLRHEWFGLDIRFDVRFKNDKPGPWETGEWLVKDGGRMRAV